MMVTSTGAVAGGSWDLVSQGEPPQPCPCISMTLNCKPVYSEAIDVSRTITKNFDPDVFDDHFLSAEASSCVPEFDV
jgi:hypothetical protein